MYYYNNNGLVVLNADQSVSGLRRTWQGSLSPQWRIYRSQQKTAILVLLLLFQD